MAHGRRGGLTWSNGMSDDVDDYTRNTDIGHPAQALLFERKREKEREREGREGERRGGEREREKERGRERERDKERERSCCKL